MSTLLVETLRPWVLNSSVPWTPWRVCRNLRTPSVRNVFNNIKIMRFIVVNELYWSPEAINYIVTYRHSLNL